MLSNINEVSTALINSPTCIPTVIEEEFWSIAFGSYERGDFESAAINFRKLGARSKPLYNVAVCYLQMDDIDSALATFERVLRCDSFLCIAYYHLAYINHQQGKIEQAIARYNEAIKCLRGNKFINYDQVGLNAVIYSSELNYNMAAAQMDLCDQGGALRSLVNAYQDRCLPSHQMVEHALASICDTNWILFEPNRTEIFQVKCHLKSKSITERIEDSAKGSREIVNIISGEIDESTQFMAPLHNEVIIEGVQRMPELLHSRKHSRSSSSVAVSSKNESLLSELKLVKAHLVDDEGEVCQSRIFFFDDRNPYGSLMEKVKSKFMREILSLKYKDDEGDMILICDDADLQAAIHCFRSYCTTATPAIKLAIWCYTSRHCGSAI